MPHHGAWPDPLVPGEGSEPAQLPLPRRVLGRGTLALLILLRVYVFVAIPIVAYAFIHALALPRH